MKNIGNLSAPSQDFLRPKQKKDVAQKAPIPTMQMQVQQNISTE